MGSTQKHGNNDHQAGPRSVPDALQACIKKAYSDLLALRGGQRRKGQQAIIGAVATAVANAKLPSDAASRTERLLVVEAPTGTGKTASYCLGAIPVALAQGLKVVLATGTISLQEQLMNEELPRIAQVIPGMTVALVKGRGRRVCVIKLREVAVDGNEKAQWLDAAFTAGEWSGDMDDLAEPVESELWAQLTNDSAGCSGKKCSRYDSCPYYVARAAAAKASVLVANHDVLLADICGGNHLLPPPESTVYIFDEAHEFAHKAMRSMAQAEALWDADTLAEGVERLVAKLRRTPGGRSLDKFALDVADKMVDVRGWTGAARSAIERNGAVDLRDPKRPWRFAHGQLPVWLADVAAENERAATEACESMNQLRAAIDTEPGEGLSDEAREQLLADVGRAVGKIESVRELWTLMTTQRNDSAPPAKWVETVDAGEERDLRVCASPVGVGDQLHRLLWSRCASAVHLSATLSGVDGFDHYLRESGLDLCGNVRCIRVQSPFSYSTQGKLIVPRGIRSPKDVKGHTEDLCTYLPEWLNTRPSGEGALVLFSSWTQMLEVADNMPAEIRERMLVQGQMTRREMLKQHREAIARGECSILFGTSSFETGVDLPGKELTLVVIAKLQFAVMSNPVEEARAEWLESKGRSYFEEVALPQAFKRLAQSTGRLLRTVKDYGEIIIADCRLTDTRYGRNMLAVLPPYEKARSL